MVGVVGKRQGKEEEASRGSRVQGSRLEVMPIVVTGPVSSRCAETGCFLPDPDLVR